MKQLLQNIAGYKSDFKNKNENKTTFLQKCGTNIKDVLVKDEAFTST